jgi:peptidoglycan/xylan/chitin deacetylase (PgdA/CDA1 family)
MKTLRSIALHALRAVGGFALARQLTRRQLRILCYHSFAVRDEHRDAPYMFMRAATFERRMRILKTLGLPVIPLEEAVAKFQRREIGDCETVITLDDGWATVLTVGAPILERYGFPASIYASTEHLTAGSESFNIALAYMVRRSGRRTLTLAGVHPQLDGVYEIGESPDKAVLAMIRAAERSLPLAERQRLLPAVARTLGFKLEDVFDGGRFRLLAATQIQELHRRGFDFQLHTHTHPLLPECDFESLTREITENREALRRLTGATARHFCYPSGVYRADIHPAWLRQLGIASATTCDPGLNEAGGPVMMLHRHLDSESSTDIEFEAELCGVMELARRARSRILGRAGVAGEASSAA